MYNNSTNSKPYYVYYNYTPMEFYPVWNNYANTPSYTYINSYELNRTQYSILILKGVTVCFKTNKEDDETLIVTLNTIPRVDYIPHSLDVSVRSVSICTEEKMVSSDLTYIFTGQSTTYEIEDSDAVDQIRKDACRADSFASFVQVDPLTYVTQIKAIWKFIEEHVFPFGYVVSLEDDDKWYESVPNIDYDTYVIKGRYLRVREQLNSFYETYGLDISDCENIEASLTTDMQVNEELMKNETFVLLLNHKDKLVEQAIQRGITLDGELHFEVIGE